MLAKLCKICGEEFFPNRTRQQFCSRDCAHFATKSRVEKVCETCLKPFEIKTSEATKKHRRFCSRVCLSIRKRTHQCCGCGGDFCTPFKIQNQLSFCPKCVISVARHNERNGHWTGGKLPVEVNCPCCKKLFVTSVTKLRQAKKYRAGRKYCSKRCSNITKNRNSKQRDTDIEQAVKGCLESRNIPFQVQVPLHGIALVDFVVEPKTVVQCDGVFWHTRPGVAERDAVQDKALKALGYEVIRVTSDELKNQSSDAVYQILVTKSAILGVRYGICPHSLNV